MFPDQEINLPALCFAMQTRDIHVAKIVLGGNRDNYRYKNQLGETLLHLAVKHNFKELINWLARGVGLDINSVDSSNRTSLHLAITTRNEDIIRYLLSYGSSIDLKDLYGKSPFHMAVQSGNIRLVELLLDHGANVLDATLTTRESAFHIALKNEDEEMFKLLLKNHRGSVNVSDEYGETLLHTLARQRKCDCYLGKLLLEKGADLELLNKDNETALHFAIHNRNFNVAKIFIEYGANVNVKNKYGESPLHLAIRHRALKLVNLLVSNNADVNECTNDANTMLHVAVNYYNEGIVDLLVHNNVDIESRNSCDLSPFHLAMKNKCIDGARILLMNNADVNSVAYGKFTGSHKGTTESRSFTPLHTTIVQKDTEAVEFLLQNGAKLISPDYEIFLTVEAGDAGTLTKLIMYGANVNAVSSSTGESLLYTAMRTRSRDHVETLLRHGANATRVDERGGENAETALHLAVKAQDVKFARFLLDIGADVEAYDVHGNTALSFARGCTNIANVLIARVALAKVAGTASGRNEAIIGDVEEFYSYYTICLDELTRIGDRVCGGDVSMLKFLVITDVAVLARLVKRKAVVRDFEARVVRSKSEFPIYHERLAGNMERATKRWSLIREVGKILCTSDYFEALYDVIDRIVDNFTDEELEGFVKGGSSGCVWDFC